MLDSAGPAVHESARLASHDVQRLDRPSSEEKQDSEQTCAQPAPEEAHCEAAGVAEERLGPTYIQLRPYAIPPPWMLALEIAERIK
eukprot:s7946_g1.t1